MANVIGYLLLLGTLHYVRGMNKHTPEMDPVEGIAMQDLQLVCPYVLPHGDSVYKSKWVYIEEDMAGHQKDIVVFNYYQDSRYPLRHLEGRSNVKCTGRECILTIKSLRPSDSGLYKCTVEFDRSTGQTKMFNLSVYSIPQKLEIRGHKQLYQKSDNMSVECYAIELEPQTLLSWQVDGKNLAAPYKVSSARKGNKTMTRLELESIDNARKHYGKELVCSAHSPGSAHQTSTSFTLVVAGFNSGAQHLMSTSILLCSLFMAFRS